MVVLVMRSCLGLVSELITNFYLDTTACSNCPYPQMMNLPCFQFMIQCNDLVLEEISFMLKDLVGL